MTSSKNGFFPLFFVLCGLIFVFLPNTTCIQAVYKMYSGCIQTVFGLNTSCIQPEYEVYTVSILRRHDYELREAWKPSMFSYLRFIMRL